MKRHSKMTKLLLMAALCFAVIGFAFCTASLCFGFSTGEFRQIIQTGKGYLEEAGDWMEHHEKSISEMTDEDMDFSKSYTGVQKLKLDIDVAECRLIPYEGKVWQVTGYDLPSGFRCTQNGNTLEIEEKGAGIKFWRWNQNGAYLEIYIPESQIIDQLDLECGVGEIMMETEDGVLICKELDLDCGVGSCILNLDIRKKMQIDCGVGDVEVNLTGSANDFDYKLECGVGDIEVDGESYAGFGAEQKINHGADREIDIECGVGSVIICFEESGDMVAENE